MSVADGFNLWVGKTIAEFVISLAVFAIVAVGFVAYVLVAELRRKTRRRP